MNRRIPFVLSLACCVAGCAARATPATSTTKLSGATMRTVDRFQASFLELATKNEAYRHVIYTGLQSQLAVMTLPPGGDVGLESHAHVEVVIFIVEGEGTAMVHGVDKTIHAGDVLVTGANVTHNIINTSVQPLRMVTVSSPPNHLDGRLQQTKEDAERDAADRDFGAALEW